MPVSNQKRDEEGRLVSGTCHCGGEVYGLGRGYDTQCEKCGQDYNSSGQALRPQSEWEETSESVDRLLPSPEYASDGVHTPTDLQEYASDDARNFSNTISPQEKALWEPFYTRWPSYDQSVSSDKTAREQLGRLSAQDQARLKPLVDKFLQFVGRERVTYDRHVQAQSAPRRAVSMESHAISKNYRPNVNSVQLPGATFAHQGQVLADLYDAETGKFDRVAVVADVGRQGLAAAQRYCDRANASNDVAKEIVDEPEMRANESHGLADDGEASHEEHDIDRDQWDCAVCGGPVVPMGKLGKRLHGRCRNCGMDQSFVTETAQSVVDRLLLGSDAEKA